MLIKVNPDGLRSVAKQQESIINNIAEEASKIDDISNQLAESWQGASGAQAHDALEEISTGLKKITERAEESTQKLTSVAEAFESIDGGEIAFAIRELSTGYLPPVRPNFILSMPGMVRIDPDRVREIAEQCKVESVTISENVSAFADSIKGLSNDWEGKAYIKYEEESTEIIRVLRDIEDCMSVLVSEIVKIANRYEEIDNSL